MSIDHAGLQLVANRPVSFRLYSSLHRTEDHIGDVVDLSAEPELHAHAPLRPSSASANPPASGSSRPARRQAHRRRHARNLV
jgi:hypothetical protein